MDEQETGVGGWKPTDVSTFKASTDGASPSLGDINDDVVQQFRDHRGVIVDGPFAGIRAMLLHTVGSRTGKPRITPLYRYDFDGKWYVIGANGGSTATPAWVHNLRLAPRTHVEVRSGEGAETVTYPIIATELTEPRRGIVWNALRRETPHIDELQANTTRLIPVLEFTKVTGHDEAAAQPDELA